MSLLKAKILKARLRREEEIKKFLENINKLMDNTDNIVTPSVQITKEEDNCYITYYIGKYPNCLKYSVMMQQKDYPFSVYYSKDFLKNDIPTKHKEVFDELEKYFK